MQRHSFSSCSRLQADLSPFGVSSCSESSGGASPSLSLGYWSTAVEIRTRRTTFDALMRRLAVLLDRLLTAWPVEVDELVLIGHSMGGLVVRSACGEGERSRDRKCPEQCERAEVGDR